MNIRDVLFTSYADRRVVEDFVWRLRPPKPTLAVNAGLYGGVPHPLVPHLGPAPDDLTTAVAVPVLIILGKDDCLWDTSKYAEEPSHYSSSPDVKLVVLPRTGHAVFHHLNHRYVTRPSGTGSPSTSCNALQCRCTVVRLRAPPRKTDVSCPRPSSRSRRCRARGHPRSWSSHDE